MPLRRLTYKSAGVDIAQANQFVERIKSLSEKTHHRDEVLGTIGGFGGLFKPRLVDYREPVLVSSADGVGTKLKIANLCNEHYTVGIDLVAMNVNDILCCGAKPLFFLDYIAYSQIKAPVLTEVIRGITAGCKEAGCALIGGETAQMPGMYKDYDYDLAGFCVGVVEKDKILNYKKIEIGNKAIGIESNGLHSNGFSLVRKIFSRKELLKYANELLKPTRIYVKPVLSLLQTTNYKLLTTAVRGIAHITGGAFYEKIPRILSEGKAIKIKKGSWPIPKIFHLIQEKGNINTKEMFRTFNMGIGMILVVDEKGANNVVSAIQNLGLKAWIIGEIIRGRKQVYIV